MRQQTVIVDVNVAITTNGRAAQASQVCQLACIDRLRLMQAKQRVALDTLQSILQEYRRHLSARGQPVSATPFLSGFGVTLSTLRYAPSFRSHRAITVANSPNFPMTQTLPDLIGQIASMWQ